MRIIDLALKDLAQILRDRKSLLFLVAMPIIFTLFMGFAYKGGNSTETNDNRMQIAWVDGEPEAGLNKALFDNLNTSDVVKPVRMDKTSALDALQKGQVDGVVVIPAGFGAQAAGGPTVQVTLIADAASTKGQSLYQVLRVPIAQLMSTVETAQLSVEAIGKPSEFAPAFDAAWSRWQELRKSSLIQVEQAVAHKPESWFGDNPYNQASPGILVQFAIFGLVTSAQILVQERKTRTLQRLMTTAMKRWEMVAGHMLAMFAIVFLQTALLVIFGQLVLKVDYMREPLGTLLIAVTLGLWVAGMGLLIGVLAKSDDQVVMFSMIFMFLFSALGGTWFPLEVAGGAFSALGRWMPSAWAMTGLQNILIRGLGLESIWTAAGILLAYAAGFFVLAVWRFGKLE